MCKNNEAAFEQPHYFYTYYHIVYVILICKFEKPLTLQRY